MRCDQCENLLDQYVEGELDEQAARSLRAHVNSCTGCAGTYELLCREQKIYASYFLDVEASPALWANLQVRIEDEKVLSDHPLMRFKWWVANVLPTPDFNLARAVALLVLVIGLTIGVMRYLKSDDANHDYESAVSVASVPPPTLEHEQGENERANKPGTDIETRGSGSSVGRKRDASGRVGRDPRHGEQSALNVAAHYQPLKGDVLRQAERQYLTDIDFLSRVANRRLQKSSPTARIRLRQMLVAIDQVIAETRHDVSQNPIDPIAVQRMMAAYSRKIEVLRAATVDS